MNEVDLAYVAGFFDGEGHISIMYPKAHNGVRYKKLLVRIAQVDRGVLEWIATEFDGKVYAKADKRAEKNGWQACYDVVFAYRKAETFLRAVYPYLRVKRELVGQLLEEAYPTPKE